MYKIFIVLVIIVMSSCKSRNNPIDIISKDTSEKIDSIEIGIANEYKKESSIINKYDSQVQPQVVIEIIGALERVIDNTSTSKEIKDLDCDDWIITPEGVEKIFPKMREVKSGEWNSYCYHYPCAYRGIANYNEVKYNFYINSASYLILEKETEKFYFILEEKNHLFLQACNCCE